MLQIVKDALDGAALIFLLAVLFLALWIVALFGEGVPNV